MPLKWLVRSSTRQSGGGVHAIHLCDDLFAQLAACLTANDIEGSAARSN
jgi:hypothetical protein